MKKYLIAFLFFGILYSCGDDTIDELVVQDTTPYNLEYGSFLEPEIPEDNPLTSAGVQLGRMLFYETMLSKGSSQACASCHDQANAFSDTLRFSLGVEELPGGRQAMAIFNMAWNSNEFFWDGRSHLLRNQSLLPIIDPLEMNETYENVIAKLSNTQDYKDQFVRAFGDETIDTSRISLALEQFMLSIVSNQSKYDLYLDGQAELTESEERGRELYFAEFNPFFPELSGADCEHCHGGLNFENDQYMNNGLDADIDFVDVGREAVSGLLADRAKFKVPSLRNIALTPPYMHDGRFSTLEEVVGHYNENIKMSSTIDPVLLQVVDSGLLLSDQDEKDLVAFLHTLTDPTLATNEDYASPF